MPFLWLGSTDAPPSHGKVMGGTFVHAHRNIICIGFRHAHPYLNGSIGNSSFCCAANAQFSTSSSWWRTAQPRINFFCRGGKSPSIGSASSILTSISSPPYSTWKCGGLWSSQLMNTFRPLNMEIVGIYFLLPNHTIPNAVVAVTRNPTVARVICLAPALAGPKRLNYTPSPVRKQAGFQSLRHGENIGRSNAQSCAAKMAAFPVNGGFPCGHAGRVTLPVSGGSAARGARGPLR